MLRKRNAYTVFLLMEGATSLFFALIFTVNMVYHVTVVHLNPLQLVLVGTLLETVVFLFEVPTGIVADVYSRRLSIIIGLLLIGFGFAIEGLFPYFGVVLFSQIFWGLGATFTSGATQAWIADEVGEEQAGKAFMRGAQIGQIGGLIGIGLSVGLGSIHIQIPIVLGGALIALLGVLMVFIMPETGFKPTPREDRNTWQTMGHTLRSGVRLVRMRPILLTFLGISAIFGLYSEGVDRLSTAHLLEDFTFPSLGGLKPVVWFGIISVVSTLLSIVTTEIVRRKVDTNDEKLVARVLMGMNVVVVAGILVFALTPWFGVALIAMWIFGVVRGATYPLFNTWMNQHLESSVRATMFSMNSQLNAIGQIAGGPAVGYIGTAGSLRAALSTSGLILSPVLWLLMRGSRQSAPAEIDAMEAVPVPAAE